MDNDTMKCLPELDRPYERAELFGINTLTDSELLAVIIKTGTKNKKAVDVSRELLNAFNGNISELCNAGFTELQGVDGIGRVKAIQLKAVGELAKRISFGSMKRLVSARDTEAVSCLLLQQMGNLRQEIFKILLIDSRMRIFKMIDVSMGTLDRALVHPREVFYHAVKESCSRIIIAHNHPSGDITPSKEDFDTTELLMLSGSVLGILVHDHIIVGGDKYYSMREKGDLEGLEAFCRTDYSALK